MGGVVFEGVGEVDEASCGGEDGVAELGEGGASCGAVEEGAPRCFSRAAMRRLATGWGMRAAAAPWVKLPRSLTWMKAVQAPTRSMC